MEHQDTLERLRQEFAEKEKARHEPCPSCGRCPTCGRGGVGTLPSVPTYPFMPWYPYPARPYLTPATVTWTTTTTAR